MKKLSLFILAAILVSSLSVGLEAKTMGSKNSAPCQTNKANCKMNKKAVSCQTNKVIKIKEVKNSSH